MNKIYVRFPDTVSNSVIATSFLCILRGAFTDALIHVALRKHLEPILCGNSDVDTIFSINRSDENSLIKLLKLAKRIKNEKYDAAFILSPSLASAASVFLARIPIRVGWGRAWLLNHSIEREMPRAAGHTQEEYGLLLSTITERETVSFARPNITLNAAHIDASKNKGIDTTNLKKPVIAVIPSASCDAKKWIPSRFAWIIDRLKQKHNASIVALGGPGEQNDLQHIDKLSNNKVDTIFTGSKEYGLAELIAILNNVDIVIGNDSGAAHIAAAMGKPAVVVLGATSPKWGIATRQNVHVLFLPAPCSPCFRKTCKLDRHICMENITPQAVLDSIETLLKSCR